MRTSSRFVLPALTALLLAAPAQAVTIGFEPSTTVASVGDSFDIEVIVSDLGGEVVSAYDLDVRYDPGVLGVDIAVLENALGLGGSEAFYGGSIAEPGLIDLAGVSLLSDAELLALQGGDRVTLATIGFTKTGEGSTSLDFVFDALNDVKGSDAQILEVEAVPGAVAPPEAIPEPSAAATFGTGLLLTGWALRRRAR
jgi:hypothetical protein